ncbi:prepilin-type N-terminal cleavage/methylation domain-containing protein [Cognatiluteimonas profundi]|uniref:prepilin-type N-terminal cleavage/methylation domain-containing protein n=1 Tax=Cognatiluteimonas profundi TaxID=2594501 RepID=UPI00131A8C3D|nr:prepilin-type N-terminal cleavage/methylation domain-containing protein [Lysobacter profundi]
MTASDRASVSPGRATMRGFTLIEVLLATSLLAAALALGFAVLSAATATVNRGEVLSQRNTLMRAVSGFLRTRIGSARAIAFALDPQGGTPILFVGERGRMRFVADLPDYLGRGGPYLHDISVSGDTPGQLGLTVAFSQVQNSTQIAEDAPRKPEPLAGKLKDVQFRYRAIDATGALGGWQEQWTQVDRLPLQVSIRVTPADGPAWPEIIIALPVASGAGGGEQAQ